MEPLSIFQKISREVIFVTLVHLIERRTVFSTLLYPKRKEERENRRFRKIPSMLLLNYHSSICVKNKIMQMIYCGFGFLDLHSYTLQSKHLYETVIWRNGYACRYIYILTKFFRKLLSAGEIVINNILEYYI